MKIGVCLDERLQMTPPSFSQSCKAQTKRRAAARLLNDVGRGVA
jgi:hypothetical protein